MMQCGFDDRHWWPPKTLSTFIAQLNAALKSSTNCLVVIGVCPIRSSIKLGTGDEMRCAIPFDVGQPPVGSGIRRRRVRGSRNALSGPGNIGGTVRNYNQARNYKLGHPAPSPERHSCAAPPAMCPDKGRLSLALAKHRCRRSC